MASNFLETERLILRKPTLEDAAFMVRLMNDPSWLRYIGDRNVRTIKEAEKYLADGAIATFEKYGFGLAIVMLKTADMPIGLCGLVKRDYLDDFDLGFALLPEYTGNGYTLEAASATMQSAHEQHGLNALLAITSPGNEPSIRLLEKLGFKYVERVMQGEDHLLLFRCSFLTV